MARARRVTPRRRPRVVLLPIAVGLGRARRGGQLKRVRIVAAWSSSSVGGRVRRATSARWRRWSARTATTRSSCTRSTRRSGSACTSCRSCRTARTNTSPARPAGPASRSGRSTRRRWTRCGSRRGSTSRAGWHPTSTVAVWTGSGRRWAFRLGATRRGAARAATAASAQPAPPTMSERLQNLGSLHSQGVLTDEEFAAAKRRVIDE